MRRIIALLNDSVPDLERQIRARVGWIAARGYDASPHTLKRLEANLASVRQVLRESYKAAFSEVRGDLLKLADYEGEYIGRMLGREAGKIGVELGGGAPTSQLLKSIVDTRPFQGRLLRDWAKELPENAYRGVRQAIRQGLTQSESIDQIVRRIKGTRANGYADGILDRSRRELETVVRTATSHVTNHARDETYRQNSDLIKGVAWTSTLDSRACPICSVRGGLLYTLEHKPVGHMIPWLGGPGRIHMNCVPAEVVVRSGGALQGVMSRPFEGDLVVVRTARGHDLPCTPNHPVLTDRGWIAARLLRVGDRVVRNVSSEWGRGVDRNDQDVPAGIKDVAEAFLKARGVRAVPVPVAAEDLHGDARDGDVAVVWSDRLLRHDREAAISQHLAESAFVVGNPVSGLAALLSGGGAHAARGETSLAAAGGDVARGGPLLSLLRGGAFHSGDLLSGAVAEGYAGALQRCDHGLSRASQSLGDARGSDALGVQRGHGTVVDGYGALAAGLWQDDSGALQAIVNSLRVESHELGDLQWFAAGFVHGHDSGVVNLRESGWNSSLSKDAEDGSLADAELAAYIVRGGAGAVLLDDVLAVDRLEFSGHVYNLETTLAAYSANGIITHNCRCTSSPVLKTFREMGLDLPEIQLPGRRVRGEGIAPSNTTYADWLKRQPAAVQNNILGVNRARDFRAGRASFDSFHDNRGRWLNLDQLKGEEAA